MHCPGCGKRLPISLERGYSKKYGTHHGSVCPYCRVHFRPATPLWVVFALVLTGWAALQWAHDHLRFSDVGDMLLSGAWLVGVVTWYATRPKIVIPKEECAD